MRRFAVLALALALCAPAAAEVKQPDLAEAGLVFTRQPNIGDMGRFYPARARALNYNRGIGEVLCTADAQGKLACTPQGSNPSDGKFDEAAVLVMQRARVAARDGGSPAGRSFAITLRFGNWGAYSLPDHFHPIEAGLRWTVRPTLQKWLGGDQEKGETWTAWAECRTFDDGRIDCTVVRTEPERPGFARAVEVGAREARVVAVDDKPVGGRTFMWVMSTTRH